jgi:RluA family pseudouridine synthase
VARTPRPPDSRPRSDRSYRLTADARHAGRRADDIAREWLRDVLGTEPTRGAVRRLIMAGALRLHGRPLRAPGRVVAAGAVLEMTVRPELVRRTAPVGPVGILYEDAALIAVDKPPGLPTVATADPSREHLVGRVERLLVARGGGTSRPLGVHQRLDRDTSGVVLFVKDPAANAALAAQFAARGITKTYLALTVRPARLPPPAFRIDEPVESADATGGGRAAVTDVRIVEKLPGGLLVEARPRTGRKHQVRIHLAGAGLAILGDHVYGRDGADRLMLHAARLELTHPLTGAALSIESPLPADFVAALERLRRPAETRGPAKPSGDADARRGRRRR